ncbi:copper-binding protein [Martelella alba]|uniref:Copper-binding protein n=2 Tax=Martelella alba TaxID=2590451 RepID=A0ABY2SGN3_9HYPH|nr:copper-binding protein [Martelella alba]
MCILTTLTFVAAPAFADDMAGMDMHTMPGMGQGTSVADMSADTATDYHSQGTILRLGDGKIAIAHSAIPALNWPAMTMTFAIPAQLAQLGLTPGDQVEFSFRQTEQGYQLTRIQPMQP